MKKIFTLIAMVCLSLTAVAEDFECGLRVILNGEPSDFQTATISCTEKDNGKLDIKLNEFVFMNIPVTAELTDIATTEAENGIEFSTDTEVKLGGGLPSATLPAKIEGYIVDGDLELLLNLVADNLDVTVALTSRSTQIFGSDFEEWHTATTSTGDKTSNEPNGWHSFMSATGQWANLVEGYPHVFISDDVREGSESTKSVRIISSNVMGIASANGTITTGRMKAGSMSPSDSQNCAFLDPDSEDVDGNGNLFYNEMKGMPTSISMWYKYKAGEGNTENNKASLRAVITDGTYYQDPADKEYTNIVAVAENQEIPETSEWTKITIPFDYLTYSENEVEPKSILVTISTCAVAGGGSKSDENPDELFVDDIDLNYDLEVSGITIFDKPIEDFDPATHEYNVTVASVPERDDIDVFSDMDFYSWIEIPFYDEASKTLTLNVFNEEFTSCATYKFNLTIDPTGVNAVEGTSNHSVVGRYNANGQNVNGKSKGIIITKYADGTVEKTLK